jgi:hypothetical protein
MCKYTNIETVELPNGKHEMTDNPPRWFKKQFEKEFAELCKINAHLFCYFAAEKAYQSVYQPNKTQRK